MRAKGTSLSSILHSFFSDPLWRGLSLGEGLRLVEWTVTFFVALSILSRKRDPVACLGWLLAVVAFPFLGSALYVLGGVSPYEALARRRRVSSRLVRSEEPPKSEPWPARLHWKNWRPATVKDLRTRRHGRLGLQATVFSLRPALIFWRTRLRSTPNSNKQLSKPNVTSSSSFTKSSQTLLAVISMACWRKRLVRGLPSMCSTMPWVLTGSASSI